MFDVNLRAPHYTQSLLEELMLMADFIKFNDEELVEISTAMGCSEITLEERLSFIAKQTIQNKFVSQRVEMVPCFYLIITFMTKKGLL